MRNKTLGEVATEREELLGSIPFWLQHMTQSYITEGVFGSFGWQDYSGWSSYSDEAMAAHIESYNLKFKKVDRRIRKLSGNKPEPWTEDGKLQKRIHVLLDSLQFERSRIDGLLNDSTRLRRLWSLRDREYKASLKCEICARPHTEITKLQFRKNGRRTRRVNFCYDCLNSTLDAGSSVVRAPA